MLTVLQIAARTLVWCLIGLGLALVLVLVRLDSGPLALDWLKPRIERALTPDSGAASVTAGGIELRLNKDERTFDLVGVDVRYRADGNDGASPLPFLVFPEVEVALSVEALLKRGMIAASEVKALAPSLIITRSEDGSIGLHSEAGFDDQNDDVDFGSFLRHFASASETDDRLSFLKTLQIGGGRVSFYDRTRASALTAKNADLVLSRRDGGIDGWLRADIQQKSADPASVQFTGRLENGAEQIAFEADIADLMPADLPALWPLEEPKIPVAAQGLRLPVRVSLEGAIGQDWAMSALTVDVQAGAGVVDLPAHLAEPLEIDGIELKGLISDDFGGFEIDQARVSSRGAVLEGTGMIVWRDEDRAVAVDLSARDVRAEDLPAFWPEHLGVDARTWVLENIKAGRVSEAGVRLDLRADDFGPAPLRDEAVDGMFAFEGVSVRYVDEMPALENGAGKAVFDADRMDFEVEGASNAGLAVTGGAVTITGMGKPGKLATQLHVIAEAEGSIGQALTILDHPPLEIGKELSFPPSKTSGSVNVSLDVRMPLHDDVTEEEAVVLAKADLIDLTIGELPKIGDNVRLDQGTFRLVLDEAAVRLEGTAEINTVPLTIGIFEPLEDETSKRRIELQGNVSREQLEGLGMSIDALDGAFGFKATVTETDNHFWIDLEADLEPLAIMPPGLVWRKSAGQAGILRASIVKPIDGPIDVKQFDLEAGDLKASGSLALSAADEGLDVLTFDAFHLGDTNAAIRLSPDGHGGFEVVVEAKRLNLDVLFGDDREIGDAFQHFHAVLRSDQLRVRGVELIDVEADAAHQPDGWRSASIIGALSSGGKLALELTPEGDDRRLELRSEDAGALIEAFDLGQRVDGGSMLLTARIRAQNPMVAEGRFEISTFVLEDAPLLARMLTLASLTGIGNLLGGEGIQMDHLILPFTLDDQRLTFSDGLLRGSQLGLTLKGDVDLEIETLDLAGTIIPVYSLNRLIGQVPIIGRILTGVDGRGAFAATFSIEGSHKNPTVYVNPLAILTPGLIRDFFGGLFNGTLEPPDIRGTDD
ncbi:MAG: AsmA-like C-terminal domain-containing protein [Geminicoccaceae bacterium]